MTLNNAHRSRSLVFETLEDRHVMAVTATLVDGVLAVRGDSGNNTVSLSQVRNQVQIDGTRLSFAAQQITAIEFDGQGGRDSLRLDRLNVGSTRWATPITVRQTTGTMSLRSTDLGSVYFGADSTLVIDQRGVTTLNGQAVDWFDRNIRTEALRQVLREDFADEQLSRNEILNALQLVRADGSMSRDEFDDLRAVAQNQDLFRTTHYVGALLRNVVIGNTANRLYQGTRLGNLAAASTVAHLDKLVGKWFYGTDRPVARYGSTTFTYTVAAGQLFGAEGPAMTDVRQGMVGDCYLVGAFAELAQQSPAEIRNMFIVNGDGTHTVRFMNNGRAEYVTVDSQLPVSQAGRFVYANMGQLASDVRNVLWVALAEKAYVQMNESGWLRANRLPGNGINAYAAISGGYMSDALRQVTGRAAMNMLIRSDFGTQFETIVAHYRAGKSIGFATNCRNLTHPGLVGCHQYVMAGYDSQARTITIFNPWGINNGTNKPGLVTLSIDSMPTDFTYWTIST